MRRVLDGPSVSPSLRDTLVLRERALQSTTVSVVISDLRLPDNPLVWVNAAFTETTGYTAEQVVGRNCRFLQGPDTDPEPVLEMRLAVKEQRASMVTVLNYRADGSAFWNSVSTAPVCDGDGDVIGFIAMQIDVTDQVTAQQGREARLRKGPGVAADAEPDTTVAFLGRVSEALAAGDQVDDIMQALVAELVPAFADGCAIDLIAGGPVSPTASRRRVAAMSVTGNDDIGDLGLVERVLRTSRPVSLIDHVDGAADDLGSETLLVVPIRGRRGVLGALTLVSGIGPRRYTDAHLAVALDIGRRAGLAVESAQLIAQEQSVSALLRESLAPPLPQIPGLDIISASCPDGSGWYDVWTGPTGETWIAVGAADQSPEAAGNDLLALARVTSTRSALHARASSATGPAAALGELPDVWVGRLSEDGVLAYAGGGLVSAQWQCRNGDVKPLTVGAHTVSLIPGDALLLCPDDSYRSAQAFPGDAKYARTLVVRRSEARVDQPF